MAILLAVCISARAQLAAPPQAMLTSDSTRQPLALLAEGNTVLEDSSSPSSNALLPSVPEPAANPERENVPYAAQWHQQPFSRIGIGADVSPLGIGIKSAIALDDYFDARALFNFLSLDTGRFEADVVHIDEAKIHMASVGAMLDAYPWNSVWRMSGGLMLFNGNQVSLAGGIAPGGKFNLGSAVYYSSNADPLKGTALVNLHSVRPAPMASFGFGRFIPRSNRHWSFPTELGAMYIGGPRLAVNTTGAVCIDEAQTACSDVSSTTNPIAIGFNNNLQAKISQWRKDLDKVRVYPILSLSAVYSFNIR